MIAVENIIAKIEAHADKIGVLAGYLGPYKSIADKWYQGNIVKALINHHDAKLLKFNINEALHRLSNVATYDWSAPYFTGGVTSAITGYIMKELDIHPLITRLGTFLYKLGIPMAATTALATFITGLSRDASPSPEAPSAPAPAEAYEWG